MMTERRYNRKKVLDMKSTENAQERSRGEDEKSKLGNTSRRGEKQHEKEQRRRRFCTTAINGEAWLLGDPQKVETSKKAEEENQGFEKLNIL
jgi:hypothetical protein